MAKKNPGNDIDGEVFDNAGKNVFDTTVKEEVEKSFLEYSYSVITSRALPDARDGLKPVHRRILFSMHESGLVPGHAFVKSARVVGDTMGKYHPHGDSAIYDAMVRLAQNFSLNTPLVEGHGNFGSPNDGPAASRYTECRLAKNAMLLVEGLDEDTVNKTPNYDGSLFEPSVLPAAFPNLLVNGSAGIAVGMATNMIPHNLNEAVSAARLLIKKPKASLEELMNVIPGPDLPTGGVLIGLDEVTKAYAEGKGSVRIRARGTVEPLDGSRGRMSLVFTELPYGVGSERIIEKIKDEIGKKRLQGIADVKDLSDRRHGIRLVVECKTGVNPTSLLSDLYRLTPLEVSFGISNLALVDGNPKTLGLKEMLEVFLTHRYEVVTRRTQFRLNKAEARKHIVEGLLIALVEIDEIVKVIKSSKDTQEAREKLMAKFILTDIQAGHILDLPLRRLVSLEVEALKKEMEELKTRITGLKDILDNRSTLEKVVDDELADINKNFVVPRKTELIGGELKEIIAAEQTAQAPLDIPNEPCEIFLTASGMLGKIMVGAAKEDLKPKKGRQKHDVVTHSLSLTSHSKLLLITNLGKAYRIPSVEVPTVSPQLGNLTIKNGVPARELAGLEKGETVIAIAPAEHPKANGIALATKSGLIKVANFDHPTRSESFDIISLKDGDTVLAAYLVFEEDELVFVSSDSSLLKFPAKLVRAQGRSGGGVAGMNVSSDATLIGFNVVRPNSESAMVTTYTGSTVKITPLEAYPSKGRGTGGVRSHKFSKEETQLVKAWVGPDPLASTAKSDPISLPAVDARRDGSGQKVEAAIEQIGSQINIEP